MAILNAYDGFFFMAINDKKTQTLFAQRIHGKLFENSAVCVGTRTVNVNTFSTTVKDEISEGW